MRLSDKIEFQVIKFTSFRYQKIVLPQLCVYGLNAFSLVRLEYVCDL